MWGESGEAAFFICDGLCVGSCSSYFNGESFVAYLGFPHCSLCSGAEEGGGESGIECKERGY